MVWKRWKSGLASFKGFEVNVASVVEVAVVDPFVDGVVDFLDGCADKLWVVVVARAFA